MAIKQHDGIYCSPLLDMHPGFVHAYSTKMLGDMRNKKKREYFLRVCGLSDYSLILPKQVHGSRVVTLDSLKDHAIAIADGLVLSQSPVSDRREKIAIAVRIADCVPLLFVDPKSRISGVAHAGWRGTFAGIATNTVRAMEKLGAHTEDISVSIGPHIGMCCYDVPRDRAQMFLNAYGNDKKIAYNDNHLWHLDIGYVNYRQLLSVGIRADHIDVSTLCTSCQRADFYSYRRDTKATFGEMIGLVAFCGT
ncbi:hypothetical protein A2Z00_02205 [Candidatus Gottesmanbacteria bacterium RBG_13_45_10]|uniref:Purine nucleoside phosphorylase n=1 Tax=Candidatus Gottesmanbacteria bacterium RBG_13_45_10 TaxID=1798370 RepID=A0A1F5ZFJ6_9BACT|nr:MAG: hypothetical protein A2Z00_02205 [Candidatus Gottesmanbacteria bacterium RBG_13_45_10]